MLIEYLPRPTFIHSLDIRTKMIGFGGVVILTFLFNNPLYNFAIAVFVGIMAFSAGMPIKKVYNLLGPLVPVFVLIMLFTGFTPPERFIIPINRSVLFYLMPNRHLGMTIGGLLQGCTFLVRLFTMVVASSLVTLTTPIDDFVQLANKLKLPYEFSFVVTTALRFIPAINRKRLRIIDAQKARGAKLEEKGVIRYIKGSIPIMVPLIINSIMMANNLSMAMLNRGYGYSRHRTSLRQISFNQRDYAACFLVVLVVPLGIYLRFGLHKGNL
ncbi:MAG: energy-coupling factor transporter transmembrane component T family protein [Eubacteriales bacterium]